MSLVFYLSLVTAMNKTQSKFSQGLILGDRFQLDSLVSKSGIADVYICHDLSEAKSSLVAKIFRSFSAERRDLDLLSQEFSLLRKIRHPNLAWILDFGILDKTKDLFIVEERVEGKDLYFGTEETDLPDLLNILSELSQAIHYLHLRGIIHGDLRPSNAILSHDRKRLKLLDFGLADWIRKTPPNCRDGSLAYAAPEILMGGKATRSSDLYSLGILIYQLLLRRLPFEDEDPGFLTQKYLQGSINLRPIERLKDGIPLSQLLGRLLDKDPVKRPQSGDEVVQFMRKAMGPGSPAPAVNELESQFSAIRLIGRQKEMSLLKERARRVRESGRGWTVFLAGEAGSGKTRCMEELRSWALLDGWKIVEGACLMRDEASYGPYRQILKKTAPLQGEEIFRFGDASRVASPGAFDTSLEHAAGQFRDLLTRELVRRMADYPTLLLLHDFHWADEATGAVLDYLSSDIRAHPVFICVSYRSGEQASEAVERVVELSIRQDRGEVLALEPLAKESVEELVAIMTAVAGLKETLGSWIFRSVGGNPFFIEEILKHLVEQNCLQRRSGKWRFVEESLNNMDIPVSIGAVLRRRIEQLSPSGREIASWLALFNRAVSIDLLSLIIARNNLDISEVLKELNRRQMVRIDTKSGETVSEFRHALISEVIRNDLPGKKRRRMHCRIAEALEQQGAATNNLQELTMHCMQGMMGEKAVRYAISLAAQARSEFAHENALRCFEFIFRDRNGLTSDELCNAAIAASETMFALGRIKESILLLKSEMRDGRKIKTDLKARMLIQLASSYRHIGDFSSQQACCRRSLRLLGSRLNPETKTLKAMLWTELAFGAILQSHPQRGLPFLDRALQLFSDCNDSLLSGSIQILAAFLQRITCNLGQALAASKKAESILINSSESHRACSALSTIGGVLTALGRYPLALEKHRQAVLLSERNRSVTLKAQTLANLAECLCRMGQMPEALKISEIADKSVIESNNPAIRCAFNAIWAETKLAADDFGGVGRILDQLIKEIEHSPALHTVGHVHFVAASYFFTLGLFDAALESINYLSRKQTRDVPFYEYELTEALRARIMFERNSTQQALNHLLSLDRSVTRKHWPYNMCIIKLMLGELFMNQQQPALAAKHAKNALRLAKAMNSIPLISRAHLILGQVYSRFLCSNLADRAVEELERSFGLIEFAGHGEVAMRAQYEMCILNEKLSNSNKSLFHAKKAYEIFCNLESHVSPDMLPVFCSVFDRAQIKKDLMRILGADKTLGAAVVVSESHDDEKNRVLLRVSTTVNSIQELDPLLEAILDQLISAMGVQRALVYLKDELTGKLKLAKGRNNKQECLESAGVISSKVLEEVNRQGNPIVSANLSEDPRLQPDHTGMVLCAPLKTAGQVLGLLYADHSMPAGGLSESAINLFAAFCNLSAIAIDNALSHQRLLKEKNELEQYILQVHDGYREIVGKSACVEALRNRIRLAAASPLDIVIVGESGTGKELIARAIHRTGRRKSGTFVPVDCGSLSDSLAEAELFGYRKGAFTGAVENRQGLLEAAEGGIIFLDEISNLPFRLQAKLLRVLQEREVRRIGETVPRKIDIQVIAATNKDLLVEIRKGRFREDLYYRLNAMEIRVPALRERLEDVSLLIHWFLAKIAELESGRLKKFSSDAMAMLNRYSYPGNVRELKNIVANSYYSTSGVLIGIEELPAEIKRDGTNINTSDSNPADRVYREILASRGNFEELIKIPFLKHQLNSSAVRGIIRMALKDSGGRYRDAFALLRIPEKKYSVTMQFLRRNNCYLDFRPFRGK
jgi:transcriptional regulator with GAF, ATPase, and Fis domain